MPYITVLGISVGLAMDAFAVSISYGCSMVKPPLKNILLISASFGLFQAFMPVTGWYAGRIFAGFIERYDHWAAFLLLAYIGIRMIIEGIAKRRGAACGDDTSCTVDMRLSLRRLFMLSVATSIDALAVGLSFSFLNYSIYAPAAVIGVVTFLFSFAGVLMGCGLQKLLGSIIEILGGVILLCIGIKILIEHIA